MAPYLFNPSKGGYPYFPHRFGTGRGGLTVYCLFAGWEERCNLPRDADYSVCKGFSWPHHGLLSSQRLDVGFESESVSHSVISDSSVTPWTVACQVPLSMNSPGKNTGVGSHFLLQGIFPIQGSNARPPQCRWVLHHLSHQDVGFGKSKDDMASLLPGLSSPP